MSSISWVLTALILLIIVISLWLAFGGLTNSWRWLIFTIQCRRHHIKIKEARVISRILKEKKEKKPNHFFSSKEQINHIIAFIKDQHAGLENNYYLILLEKLYRARRQVEQKNLEQNDQESDLKSTQQIPVGQRFSISINDEQLSYAELVANNDYLFLKFEEEPQYVSRTINVYFWHNGVGYGFQSTVAKREELSLLLPHSETLLKRQRRAEKRASAGFPAEFYLIMKNTQKRYSPENENGFPCELKDISEGGAAILAEGRGQVNLLLKVQFNIGDKKVIMCGEVKAVTYDAETNYSTLHLQSDGEMPFEMREPILAYVYGITGTH